MAELFLVSPTMVPVIPNAPADAEARAAALNPRASFLVEAPAGSGKTALLIQRYLTLLAQPGVNEPGEVLAITFTRDATAELRDRVLRQLQLAEQGDEPLDSFARLARPLAQAVLQRDRELGWQLLDYPRRLNIQTIDAVCAEIARSLPVLSGAGAGLSPSDEPVPLYKQAAHRTLMLLGGSNTGLTAALEIILLHRDADLQDTESLIANMLSLRDQWADLVPLHPAGLTEEALDRDMLPRLQKALDRAICRGLTQLARVLPAPMLEDLCDIAAELGHADGYDGNPSPVAVCAGRYGAPGERADHLEHWRALIHLLLTGGGDFRKKGGINSRFMGFTLDKTHVARLTALIDQVRDDEAVRQTLLAVRDLPPAEYPPEQWTITKALFRVLSHALVELQLVFAERAECDFAELSLLARAALRRDGIGEELALSTGARLQHLLVDEMQDTSSAQYELIHLLTRSWDGHSQTVFLVGDPKQSIYLFREARVERFVETMHHGRLGDVPLTVLHLTANFRSQANLIDAFNEDFQTVFPPVPARGLPAEPARVSYLAASATRPATRAEPRQWHTALVADKPARLEQTAQQCFAMRELIEQWRARPLPPGRSEPWRLAVLVRGRAHLAPVLAALREGPTPIPYRAVNIEALGERQEILDLLALTRALLHPADRTAWLALLRSPLCGLSLDALHRVSGADDLDLMPTPIPGLLASRTALLQAEDQAPARQFLRVMEAALDKRGSMPLSAWVHQTWLAFRAERFLSRDELRNAERFFELLDALTPSTSQAGDQVDLALLTARLEKLYANPSSEPGAVDLMTIHNAKGLEWDVVFVPSLERRAGADRARLLSWLELDAGLDNDEAEDDGAAHGLLAPIQARGAEAAALNRWMRSVQGAREAAEVSRLFYVACTRAREELHLFSATTQNKSGEPSAPAGTLLCTALPVAAPHFTAAASDRNAPLPLIFPARQAPAASPAFEAVLQIAASAPARTLRRIPASTFAAPPALPRAAGTPPFLRPAGSYSARALGNALHAFLEQMTRELASGTPLHHLQSGIAGRGPRILAVLRAAGLSFQECERLVPRILGALQNTLHDPAGQWVLAPHPQGSTESTLREAGVTLRPDRTFLAGAEPLSSGESHLWIVDYKATAQGGRDLNLFLEEERVRYTPQLQTYEAALAGPRPVRLALYYPAIPALVPIPFEEGQPDPA